MLETYDFILKGGLKNNQIDADIVLIVPGGMYSMRNVEIEVQDNLLLKTKQKLDFIPMVGIATIFLIDNKKACLASYCNAYLKTDNGYIYFFTVIDPIREIKYDTDTNRKSSEDSPKQEKL